MQTAIDQTYKEHEVFNQLTVYADFYRELAFSVFSLITMGTRSICNIDSYVFSSIQGTLESIRDILFKGRINDSYALLRKYYDSVIINIYSNLYLSDNFSLDNFLVKKIDDWLQGKERLPEYRVMSGYIKSSSKLTMINNLLFKDNTYKNLRDRCNDHTHYNFYHNLLLNDNEIFYKNRLSILDEFSKDLENVFVLHFAYLLYLNDQYMMSSDYIDSMDVGVTPEEGSQYFVAPFIQKVFDSVIKKSRMDIATEILNKTAMKLK
jgi:hypothetical protein